MTGRPLATALCLTTAAWYERTEAIARLVRAIPHVLAAARIECGIDEGATPTETRAHGTYYKLAHAAEGVCERYAQIQGFFEACETAWPREDVWPLTKALERYDDARQEYDRTVVELARLNNAVGIDSVVHCFIPDINVATRVRQADGSTAIYIVV